MTPKFIYCEKTYEKEMFNVTIIVNGLIKTVHTDIRPVVEDGTITVKTSDTEYYYKLSVIDGYEIQRYTILCLF